MMTVYETKDEAAKEGVSYMNQDSTQGVTGIFQSLKEPELWHYSIEKTKYMLCAPAIFQIILGPFIWKDHYRKGLWLHCLVR